MRNRIKALRGIVGCLSLFSFFISPALAQDEAEPVVLSAIIRDFRTSHPDMDLPTGGVDVFASAPERVLPELGSDGTPVFNEAGLPFLDVSSAEFFHDWFHDVPGTNLSLEFPMELERTRRGRLAFNPNVDRFNPINDMLFGNEEESNNNHFTLQTRAYFTYRGGELFSLTSDDDSWLFVNNQLAIDLGGMHDVLNRSVRFDNLDLTPGVTYPIDLFYAERKWGGTLSFFNRRRTHVSANPGT